MVKTFFVRPGHFAHSAGIWYEPGILLVVEPQDRVDVYLNRGGKPATCLGRHKFAQLSEQAPPLGLMTADHPADSRTQRTARTRVAA